MSAIDDLINDAAYDLGGLCKRARIEIDTLRGQYHTQAWELDGATKRAEAAEAQRDELQTAYNNVIAMLDEAHHQRDELAAQLATAQAERNDWELNARTCHMERRAISAQLATAQARIAEAQIPCNTCGGSGFSKPGSGYDAVCDDCTGGYVGYATGEMVHKMQDEIDKLQIDPQRIYWMTLSQQHKSDAVRFESERNAAIDSAEYYKHTFLGMQTRIDELTSERDALQRAMRDYMSEMFAHTAPPTDWDQETPLGKMLDGIGDEVE